MIGTTDKPYTQQEQNNFSWDVENKVLSKGSIMLSLY